MGLPGRGATSGPASPPWLAAHFLWPWHAAGAGPPRAALLPPDRGRGLVRLRQPDAARLQALREQRAFQYVDVSAKMEQTPWDALGAGACRPRPTG
ncbi:MAG: hypothetical protein WKG07_13990 [Hymenobacter sp.]